jgi:hypothetical protein
VQKNTAPVRLSWKNYKIIGCRFTMYVKGDGIPILSLEHLARQLVLEVILLTECARFLDARKYNITLHTALHP